MTKKFAGAFALLFELSATMWAAGGSLSGVVTAASGAAIAGARVVAVSATQGLQTKAGTDAKGAYRFPVLAVGQYDLKVEAPGYKPSVHRIVIHVDDKVRLDVVLEPDIPAASAPVERFANHAKVLTQGYGAPLDIDRDPRNGLPSFQRFGILRKCAGRARHCFSPVLLCAEQF